MGERLESELVKSGAKWQDQMAKILENISKGIANWNEINWGS